MIAGIEGIHSWWPPGAAGAAVELGRMYDNAGKVIFPQFKLKSITGLSSTGESEDNRDKRLGSVGENVRPSKRRGKTITYEGWVRAGTAKSLREAEDTLREAFGDQTSEGKMVVSWHPLNAQFAGVTQKFFEARALGVDIVDTQETKRFERRFVAAVRTSDPRYFEVAAETKKAVLTKTNTAVAFA